MPVFIYEGKSLDGSVAKGIMDAEDKEDVKEALRNKGIFPTSIRENNKGATLEFSIKKVFPLNIWLYFVDNFTLLWQRVYQ